MKHYHVKRLRKLIAFLRALPRKNFNFRRIVTRAKANGHVCGTVCCAVGWMPAVFPRFAKWNDEVLRQKAWDSSQGLEFDVPFGLNRDCYNPWVAAVAYFFGIDNSVACNLFSPGWQESEGVTKLGETATPKQVAAMLEEFLEKNAA